MSEYTDIKNNTYGIREVLLPNDDPEARREEIMEALFRVLAQHK